MKLCLKTECILHGKPRVKFGGDFKDVAIAFVGESPGRDDEKMGLPLIGEAGKLLREQAAIAGLSEYNCLIANSAMCYLPKDDLKQKEINSILSTCRSHLTKALHITKPKVIVTFGAIAAKQIIKATSLAPIRGTFIWSDEFNCWVFPTYSPSHCLVKPSSLDLLMADFYRLKTFIKDGYTLQQAKEGDIHVEIRESIKDIIASAGGVSYDTETQGLDYINPTNVMISYSIATSPTQAYQVMLHELTTEDDPEAFSIPWEIGKGKKKVWTSLYVKRSSNFDLKLAELRQLFSSPTIKKVMMNGNYDIHHTNALFRNADQSPPELNNYTIDIQLLAHLVNENIYARCSLEQLRKSFTTISSQYDSEFNSEFDKSNMLAVPKADLVKYAGADACVTYAAAKGLVKALQDDPEKDKIQFYLRNMVMPVTSKVLYTLEQNGILVDMHELPGVKKELLNQQEQLYYKLIEAIPECIKEKYRDKRSPEAPLSKTNMIREMLYTKAGLNIPMMKDKKKNSTDSIDKKVRVELKSKKLSKKAAEFIENYDQWTVLNTLLTRYITGIEKSVRVDGKIHSSYSLGVASTGRSACFTGDMRLLTEVGYRTFEELSQCAYVNVRNSNKKVTLGQVWYTGERECVEVVIQGVEERRIRCTPDHHFRLKDGTSCSAKDLLNKYVRGDFNTPVFNPEYDFYTSVGRVVRVTPIGVHSVYDFSEPETQWGVVEGAVVHNSSNPNLQNLPKRGSLSNIIRKLFISPPGYVFISADASQCLVPETELYTIDGIKTLAEVIENKHPVLSMTSEYDFEFRDVVHGWCTGENEVFEMLLEDGSKVTATANHKFYDYYGNVKRMDELDTGDRLLHVNLNHMQSSYPELSLGLERAKGLGGHTNIRIHRVVGKYLNNNSSIKGMHVHHKDHDINNWHRTNIEICDSNGGHVKSFHSVGKNNPNYGKLKGTSKICPVCGKEFYASSSRKQITCSNTCRFIMFPPWNKKPCNSRICKECGKSFTPSRNIRIFCSRFCSIEASRKRLQGNHRIIRIKSVGFRKTYQIEVDHNHNYVLANGLLSKNCELRWATFLSTEPTMSEIYSSGGDIHGKTAEIIVGKSREEMGEVVYKEARQKAKCFHPDTEVLTPSGWKSMRNLTLSDTLMQAVPVDGEGIKLEWTKPTHCTLELNHTSSLVHLKSENINIKVTPDHRMLVEGSTGKFKVVEPSAFAHARSFWNAGLLKTDASSIEEERIIRLMVATQADGSLGSSFIKFGFYKQRKIERLLSLLREGEYKVAQHKNGKNKPVVAITLQGDLVNRIKALLSEDKTFDWSMLLWSLEDRKVVLDEVKYWDSYAHGNGRFARFSSALKKNCDVLQALCNISLQKAKIFEEHNSRYTTGVMYSLHISPIAKSRGTNGEKFSAFSYTEYPYEEEVAIISVPSSFLLVRGGSSDGTQIPLIVGQCVNFGFLYGAGWRTFQRVAKIDYGLEISDEEAQHIREAFFSSYSALREYHRKIRAFCHQHKYVISPLGRVRHLPEIDSNDSKVVMDTERQALNHAIQSVASDSVLLSALEIMKVSPPEECTPVLFIHDELTFQVREDLIDKYTRIIRHHMVNPPLEQFGVHLSIPLGSDCKVGRNLAEMVDYEIQD